MQVTLKRYTNWLPDSMAQGGYKPRTQWDAYLNKSGILRSSVVGHVPAVIPQNEKFRNSYYKSDSYLVEAVGIEPDPGVLPVVINDNKRQ